MAFLLFLPFLMVWRRDYSATTFSLRTCITVLRRRKMMHHFLFRKGILSKSLRFCSVHFRKRGKYSYFCPKILNHAIELHHLERRSHLVLGWIFASPLVRSAVGLGLFHRLFHHEAHLQARAHGRGFFGQVADLHDCFNHHRGASWPLPVL